MQSEVMQNAECRMHMRPMHFAFCILHSAAVLCIVHFAAVLCILHFAALLSPTVSAQLRRPRADVTPLVETESVPAGSPVRVALKVSLPEGLHTQSNKPRDPLLIPTEITIDTPSGVTVEEIVWPPSTDFNSAGQDKPLAVFEHEFAVGIPLKLAPTVPTGELVVPVKLRYQACDANLCYPPTTAQTQWTIKVAPGAAAARQHAVVFDKIRFGTGENPRAALGTTNSELRTESSEVRPSTANAGDPLAQLADFEVLSTTGGYLGSNAFLEFVHNAERAIKEKGLFEGRGPLAILLIVFLGGLALNITQCVLPMIPINLAIIGAGAQAGSRGRGFLLGSVYGALMAGACVAPVVIQVVLFSSNLYATGTRIALALPFFLGIGMAVPWPIAGAGLAALPKPGAWMVRVKQVLGVLILATAAYYGYLAYELISNRWVDAGAVESSVQEKIKEGWHASLANGLAAAERERKPVLIDLWATWCKNCLTMDQTTLENSEVTSALGGYVKVKFQAENPDE